MKVGHFRGVTDTALLQVLTNQQRVLEQLTGWGIAALVWLLVVTVAVVYVGLR